MSNECNVYHTNQTTTKDPYKCNLRDHTELSENSEPTKDVEDLMGYLGK